MRQCATRFNLNLLILLNIFTHLGILSTLVELAPSSSVEQATHLTHLAWTIMNDLRAERLQVMLSPEELAAVDDFRHRMPTRAAAVRELLKFGLAAMGVDAIPGVKSSSFGVFGRGADGHTQGDPESGTED
jgi:hypothetical protein